MRKYYFPREPDESVIKLFGFGGTTESDSKYKKILDGPPFGGTTESDKVLIGNGVVFKSGLMSGVKLVSVF